MTFMEWIAIGIGVSILASVAIFAWKIVTYR
jgi:hypothetical protein